MNKKNWFFCYHSIENDEWSLPKGLAQALRNCGINIFEFAYKDPENIIFPENKFFIEKNINVVVSFNSGKCKLIEDFLLKLKKELNLIIVCELGDEPQTLKWNSKRAAIADLSLTPDYRSSLYWQNQGYHCVWFNHWSDSAIYKTNPGVKKDIYIGTSMGKRKYDILLKLLLGNSYVNKRCSPLENAYLYQKSKIVFQYARWNEITRRIFEAAACNCIVLTNRLPSYTQIETIFAHNVSVVYYEGLFDLIYQLIKLKMQPNKYKEVASNAYEIVINNHTEKNRASYLIQLINDLKK